MSLVMAIVIGIFVYRFWDVLRVSESTAKKSVVSGLNALAKGAAKLEAQTPNLTAEEFAAIAEGRKQLITLENIESMTDEELRQLFEANAKTSTKVKAKK